MDAIELLKKDHRAVDSLFAKFEKLSDGAAKEKKAVVQRIMHELSVHASIEEEIFYPAARKALKPRDGKVLEALEEHHVVKVLLNELQSLSPTSERYKAKVTVLKEMVKHHVEEEETDLFPTLRKKIDRSTLGAIGQALEAAKKFAPTRPHPSAPDQPPANLITALPAAMIDKVRDLVASASSSRAAASRKKQKLSVGAQMNRVVRAKPAKRTKAKAHTKGVKPTKR
jgi:hemerythrin superfamily protein